MLASVFCNCLWQTKSMHWLAQWSLVALSGDAGLVDGTAIFRVCFPLSLHSLSSYKWHLSHKPYKRDQKPCMRLVHDIHVRLQVMEVVLPYIVHVLVGETCAFLSQTKMMHRVALWSGCMLSC